MHRLDTEVNALAQWPTAERVRALKRIIPRAKVQEVLRRTGHARRRYLRLPAWFMVWFVIALGLFCRDSYRQVFKWLQPFRRKGTPGRSTLCEARRRLGVAPLHRLAQPVIELQATPDTPGAFYEGLRLMALDSFVVDVADSVANARVFGRPGSGRSPAAFPQARVLALCEVGTHVLWRTLGRRIGHRRIEDAPTGASRAAERNPSRRGSGNRWFAVGPLRGACLDERGGAAEQRAAATVVVHRSVEGPALSLAGMSQESQGTATLV